MSNFWKKTSLVLGFALLSWSGGNAEEAAPAGMVWIPAGEFSMGMSAVAEKFCTPAQIRDAKPVHRVKVDGFWMDQTEVTNDEFQKFVTATSYVTVAERKPKPEDFPGVPAEALLPGSIVFHVPTKGAALEDFRSRWQYVPGANWKSPEGPGSNLEGRGNFPVVHICWEDAAAYSKWANKRLPTEAEWEYAARGGMDGKPFVWGEELPPGGKLQANVWQGEFPNHNTSADGYAGLAPVKKFPPNPYQVYDLAGNVWEWCSDWYREDTYVADAAGVKNPKGPAASEDPQEPGVPKKVQRGGSFLCAAEYCTRYVLGSRSKGEPMSAANHTGFRCVRSGGSPEAR
ncbi:MAG: formylglycine-generating enzyme family protein [Luteolibacter sp.]